jgi:hypothetical protein
MPKIGFYRQARYDGGMRTGIGIDDQTVLHDFQPGAEQSDPALLWYVDVAVEGDRLPSEPDAARTWLFDQSDTIAEAFREVGNHLEIGLDSDASWPFRVRIRNLPRGIRGEISISGARRLSEGELARQLTNLANTWTDTLERLTPMAPV